jgi:hypothetical protein
LKAKCWTSLLGHRPLGAPIAMVDAKPIARSLDGE